MTETVVSLHEKNDVTIVCRPFPRYVDPGETDRGLPQPREVHPCAACFERRDAVRRRPAAEKNPVLLTAFPRGRFESIVGALRCVPRLEEP